MSDRGQARAVAEMPMRCPACEHAGFEDRRVLADLATRTCTSCGLVVSAIERSGPTVSEFGLVDEEAYLRSVGTARRRQARRIIEWLGRHVRPGSTILDVGCSFGFFLAEARRAGYRVTGLEPDAQAYGFARRLLGDDVVRPGLLDDRTPERSADIVSTLDVVEHIPLEEYDRFTAKIRAVLRPPGIWVLKVPSTEGLYYRASDLIVRTIPSAGASLVRRLWQTRYEYPHLVYFSRPSLTRWLDRFGFDVLAHGYLPEVPPGTVIDRLSTDGDIGRAKAYLVAPAVVALNAIDSIRRRSDALVVFARPRR